MAIDKAIDSTQLDADLTSVANAIRTKGGTSAQLAFPADFVSAINAISGGGGSSFELLASAEVQINTTSTTSTVFHTFTGLTRAWTDAKMVYIRGRDKAGPRQGYYYGFDQWFINNAAANGITSTTLTTIVISQLKYSANSTWSPMSSTSYGMKANGISDTGKIEISARYSSSYSSTINGTFKVEVYLLSWPDNTSPFAV